MKHEDPPPGPYRIQMVAELTGVAETTLRAWERRYGVPSPERTAAGYRLYGPRDVSLVREMMRLCEEEGLAPAEAARVVTGPREVVQGESTQQLLSDQSVWDGAIASILAAVDAFDDAALDDALRRLLLLGHANLVVDRVITPVLHVVGDKWHRGELTVAQEHLVSNRISTFMRGLLQLTSSADDGPRAVLGCFADDTHEIGLLATALRLASWSVRPVFLGARTPPGAIRNAIDGSSARMVALSTTLPLDRARARELIDDYANACGAVPWIVGGACAESLKEIVEAAGGVVAPASRVELRALVMELLAKPLRRRP